MNRFRPVDYLLLELGSQLRRFGYTFSTVTGSDRCFCPPRKIAIEASSFCNLRCIHCAHGADENGKERLTRKKSNMTLDTFYKIADEASHFKNSTKLVFALMGEPLMNRNFIEMIRYAHSKGLWTQVNTNAMLLSKEKGKELIKSGVDFIYLSLDGITKETYESIRKRGSFTRVLNNILDFIETKYEMGALDLTIHVGMTAEIVNKHEIDTFVKEFSKLPIDAVYSPKLFNWLSAIEWAPSEQPNSKEIYRPVCNSSYDICGIQSDGSFTPCIYDFDGRYVSGNVNEDSILSLWNNDLTRNFRRAIVNRNYYEIEKNGPMCSNCSIMWNPQYQVQTSLLNNFKSIVSYTRKAFATYNNKENRRLHSLSKYRTFKINRESFFNNLVNSNTNQYQESKMFDIVQTDGVLRLEA